MTNTFYQYADNLIDNGYKVLPIGPGVKWPQEYRETLDERGRTGEWRNAWNWEQKNYDPDIAKFWPECGIGIMTGEVIAVDIDIMDPALAAECATKFIALLGEAKLQRTWQAPKRMLLYRTDTPFQKMKMGKIEILAQGQQFVAYGKHPATGGDTTWTTGDSPEDTAVLQLTTVTEQQVRDALTEINAGLPSEYRGDELKTGVYGQQTDVAAEMVRGNDAALKGIMSHLPNGSLHWDDWNRVGMLLYAATAGSELGFELFDKFSQQSPKYDAVATLDRWQTIQRSPPKRSPGMRSLVYIAKEHGWVDHGANIYPDMKGQDDDMDKLLRKMGVGAQVNVTSSPPFLVTPRLGSSFYNPPVPEMYQTVHTPTPTASQASPWATADSPPTHNEPEAVDETPYIGVEVSRAEEAVERAQRHYDAVKPEKMGGAFKYSGVDENGAEYTAWLPQKFGGGMHKDSPLHKIHDSPTSRKSVDASTRLLRVMNSCPTLIEAVDNLFDPDVCPEIAKFFRAVKSATASPHTLAVAAGLGVASAVTSAAYCVAGINTHGRKDNFGEDQTGLYMLVTAASGVGKNALTKVASKILSPQRGYADYVQTDATSKHAFEHHMRTTGRCIYFLSDEAGKKSTDKGSHENSTHEFLLKMYASSEFKSTARAGSANQRPFSVPSPAVTYAAISTPSDLFNTFSDDAMAGGYANRMLVMPAIASDAHFKFIPLDDGEASMEYVASVIDGIAAGAVSLRQTGNKMIKTARSSDPRSELAATYTTCSVDFNADAMSPMDVLRPEVPTVTLQIPPESMLVMTVDLDLITGIGNAIGIEDFSRSLQNAKRVAAILQRIRTLSTPEDLRISPEDAKLAVKLVIGCLEAMAKCREEYSARSRLIDLSDRILEMIQRKNVRSPGTHVSQKDIVAAFKGEENVPKAIDWLQYSGMIEVAPGVGGRKFALSLR